MRLIDADDLYQKCIEIQLKKRNRYFDIDDVIKLIKKAPTVDVLNKIRVEIKNLYSKYGDGFGWEESRNRTLNEVMQIIDKCRGGRSE